MTCRICGQEVNSYEKVENCIIGHGSVRNVKFRMPTADIMLYKCNNCSHIQAETIISDEYYDNYTLLEGYEQTYYGLAENVISGRVKKLKELANNNNYFLDIGCGQGDTLKSAKKYFDNCVGVEPSEKEYEKAKEQGLNVIKSYFDDSVKFDYKISAFISNMVFEHLDNPLDTLKCAYNLLDFGGVGLITVPNGQRIDRNKLYDQIIAEHINYYSPMSISVLAFKSGFDIVSIEEDKELLELSIYLRKPKIIDNFIKTKELQKSKLSNMVNHKNITIWGAGCKANIYSELLTNENVTHIIDTSVCKKDKYISGIDIPVEIVSNEIIDKSDIIIIFATTYKDEIINDLTYKYKYVGKIIYFENNDIKCIELR